jgi:Uma2 family endonuclease
LLDILDRHASPLPGHDFARGASRFLEPIGVPAMPLPSPEPRADEWLSADELPRIDHLVTEDDEPVDNTFSEKQQRLLTESLYSSWTGPEPGRPFEVWANVGLFFGIRHPPLVPDVMLSLDVRIPDAMRLKQNRSYFVWEYGKPPDLVIEIVSNKKGNEAQDKLREYARIGVPYYSIFDPDRLLGKSILRVYELRAGQYIRMTDPWMPMLGIGLTLWTGSYEGRKEEWLRWRLKDGSLLPTGKEQAEQEHRRAEQEHRRAEQEHRRAEQESRRASSEARAREAAEQEIARLRALLEARD